MLLVLGDFNARVGLAIKPTELHGAHNTDKCNNNGERLLDLCNKHGLVITNTLFPHKKIHQWSRTHSNQKEGEHVLTYILVNQKFRALIFDTRTHSQHTDHNPVVSKIRIDYKRQQIKTNNSNFKHNKIEKNTWVCFYFINFRLFYVKHNKPNTFNLDNKTIEKIKKKMKRCLHKRKHSNLNEIWQGFKAIIKTITQFFNKKATKAEKNWDTENLKILK